MRRSSAVFTVKNMNVKQPKLISGIFVNLLKLLKIFGIQYYVVDSKTTESIYVVVFNEDNRGKGIKIRFSNHERLKKL